MESWGGMNANETKWADGMWLGQFSRRPFLARAAALRGAWEATQPGVSVPGMVETLTLQMLAGQCVRVERVAGGWALDRHYTTPDRDALVGRAIPAEDAGEDVMETIPGPDALGVYPDKRAVMIAALRAVEKMTSRWEVA